MKEKDDEQGNARAKRGSEGGGNLPHPEGNEDLYVIIPPNGGWGWLVVFCAFYCNAILDGIQLTFGIYLSTISRDLKAEYSQVAFAGSLMFGVHLLMGPVCSGLDSIFGLRIVTIFGALICSFGIAISYFSPNFWFLCASFGLIGGIGLGFVYMNTLVITSLYFTTLLPAAIAIVVSGTGVGTVIFATMENFFLRHMSWQISFLYLAALSGSMSIAALAFKPIKPRRVKITNQQTKKPERSREEDQKSEEVPAALLLKTEVPVNESYSSLATIRTAARGFAETAVSSEFMSTYRKHRFRRWLTRCRRKSKEPEVLLLSEIKTNDRQPRSSPENKQVSESGSPKQEELPVHRIHSSVSYKTVYRRIEIHPERSKHTWQSLKKPIQKMFDFHLMSSFSFTLFVLIGAVQLASFLIVIVYEKDRSESLGISNDVSAYFIVAIGASNVFWRLFLGGIAIIPGVHHFALASSGIIIGGLATIFSGFSDNVVYQFGFCFTFSMAIGSFAVFRMPFLVQMVGIENVENATGINLLFMGVFCIVFPPFFGWVLKLTDSFDPMFIATGVLIVVCGILQFAVKKKVSRKRTPDDRRNSQSTLKKAIENL